MAASPDDLREWLALLQAPGIGAARALALSAGFGGPGPALRAPESDLVNAGVPAAAVRSLKHPDWAAVDHALDWLSGHGCHVITVDGADYPPLLRCIPDPPPVLFVRGERTRLCGAHIAIVGSRNATRPGADTARSFASALARGGLGIVSGLAAGIDAAAHRGALAVGGVTVAVAAHGLDQVYPRIHRELADQIADSGALVSEFLPGIRPLREHFPRRNRIISGLSLGVLVVEAAVRSGSLITARLAGEQGREVFAIPGSIHNPMARGCHRLIRQGAKLVETVSDLLEELGWDASVSDVGEPDSALDCEPDWEPDDDYVTLLTAMGHDTATVDILVQRTGLTPQALSSMLLTLELRGIVDAVEGSGYVRAAKRD